MSKVYGVMLVGCGHIGEAHISQIYYRDNIRIVAVVDTDPKAAALFARKYGADYYGTDFHEFLDLPELDIVIIATYVDTHLPFLKDCVAAGKHVLCEKPIAKNLEDGREFYDVVKKADVKVLIAHILRYNATYQKIKELIQSGAIGQLKVTRMVQNHHALNWPRYKRLLADCSPILDCGVHYIDVLQWFSGSPIVEVMGRGMRVDNDLPRDLLNYGIITMRLADGSVGYYEAGWGQTFSSANLKEFVGTKGRITLTLNSQRGTNLEMGDKIELFRADTYRMETINVHATYKDMWQQLSALIDLIEGNPTDAPDIDELYSAFLVALAADKAMRENTNIVVDREGL